MTLVLIRRLKTSVSIGLIFILALAVSSCFQSGTDSQAKTPKSCAEISDSVFTSSTGEPQYRVLSPNGGEVFHVGEKLKVLVTAKDDSEAVASLSIRIGSTFRKLTLPESPRGNFNPRNHCDLSFTIPDSVSDGLGKKVSLISDSVKVMVAKYNAETFFFDYSDAFFRIVP